MFPPLLCPFLLFGLLLSTRRILISRPHSQRTLVSPGAGRGPGLLPRDRESPCRSHWASFCAAWYPPLKLPLVEQIALKHRAISCDEAAPCILGYLFGGAGVVENNLRKHAVRPAANTEIHVVAYLAGNDRCVRSLRGKNEMDTKCPPLPCNGGPPVFNLRQQLLPLAVGSGFAIHSQYLSKNSPMPRRSLIFP
mgnify:CR=1 FL=1